MREAKLKEILLKILDEQLTGLRKLPEAIKPIEGIMKNFKNLTAVLGVILLMMPNAYGRDFVLAISPYMEPSAAKKQNGALLRFLTHLQPGDQVTLVDGYHLKKIGDFNIPTDPKYKHPKVRMTMNKATIGALMRFGKNAMAPGGDNHPTVVGAVQLPQLLRYVANNLKLNDKLDVIVLGSPLVDDPRSRSTSMAGGLFPSDGHLSASQSATPYSASNANLLSGVNVHIGYGDEHIMNSDQHHFFVKRFWTLFVEQQGGKLTSFVGDLPTLFARINNHSPPLSHDFVPVPGNKLEMIQLPPEETVQSIYDRPISTTPLTQSEIQRASHVEIGISWTCTTCDIDLYAQPMPNSQTLFWAQTASPQGRYWKDYRNSPKPTNGFETIAFYVPLDLRVLRIALNFYEGDAPQGVSGEIRLSINGKTYASDFNIPATTGNKGEGVLQAIESGQTVHEQSMIIDPLGIVKL